MNAPLLLIGVAFIALPFLLKGKAGATGNGTSAGNFDPSGLDTGGSYDNTRGQTTTPSGGTPQRVLPDPALVHYAVDAIDYVGRVIESDPDRRSSTAQDSSVTTVPAPPPTPIAQVPVQQQNPSNDLSPTVQAPVRRVHDVKRLTGPVGIVIDSPRLSIIERKRAL